MRDNFYFLCINLSTFIAHYPRVSSKRFTFTLTLLVMLLDSRLHNSGADKSFPVLLDVYHFLHTQNACMYFGLT
jgi:hypothetical protein